MFSFAFNEDSGEISILLMTLQLSFILGTWFFINHQECWLIKPALVLQWMHRNVGNCGIVHTDSTYNSTPIFL